MALLLTLTLPQEILGKKSNDIELSIKQIVEKYYANKPLFVGSAGLGTAINSKSGKILDKEFGYVTPANDFKQTAIHPRPKVWSWEKADKWIEHIKSTKQIVRLHAPISPQASKWAKEDNRTAEELSNMMDEYLIALYTRYASNPQIKWIDVVNETIFHENKASEKESLIPGGWFCERIGTDRWENPWTIIGYDDSSELKVPRYINRAFELARTYAPNVKFIYNQQGQFEAEVWEKLKQTIHYLKEEKKHRVDGIGWQAHVEAGWEKKQGNMERLAAFIDWCHSNHMEFHITEFNVYTNKTAKNYTDDEQAETFCKITELMLSKLSTGIIGINFWNIQDDETGQPKWKGAMWDNNGKPKVAYFKFKQTLINAAK